MKNNMHTFRCRQVQQLLRHPIPSPEYATGAKSIRVSRSYIKPKPMNMIKITLSIARSSLLLF